MLAIASSLTFASGPNQIKGSVEGQPLNQAATPLEGIRLQALNSAGVERDACQSGHSGGFLLKLPSEDSLYRLIAWDEFNRWWGREISQLHNDGKHNDLGSIMLRPQTSGLSDAAERREQATIIGWVWKHNLLSAAMMELHLGAFDRPAQPSPVPSAGPVVPSTIIKPRGNGGIWIPVSTAPFCMPHRRAVSVASTGCAWYRCLGPRPTLALPP